MLCQNNRPFRATSRVYASIRFRSVCCLLISLLVFNGGHAIAFADVATHMSALQSAAQENDAIFLVATEQLQGSSFEHAVILLTHYSDRGATGLTINRPTGIPLRQAFPDVQQLQHRAEPLYLGGPVSTNAIFVLLRTQQPSSTMHRIAGDIYFSTANNVFLQSPKVPDNTATRTYAGYVGWAVGQLQNEISRGDWLMVHTHPEIIFAENPETLWRRLIKRWTGKWI